MLPTSSLQRCCHTLQLRPLRDFYRQPRCQPLQGGGRLGDVGIRWSRGVHICRQIRPFATAQ